MKNPVSLPDHIKRLDKIKVALSKYFHTSHPLCPDGSYRGTNLYFVGYKNAMEYISESVDVLRTNKRKSAQDFLKGIGVTEEEAKQLVENEKSLENNKEKKELYEADNILVSKTNSVVYIRNNAQAFGEQVNKEHTKYIREHVTGEDASWMAGMIGGGKELDPLHKDMTSRENYVYDDDGFSLLGVKPGDRKENKLVALHNLELTINSEVFKDLEKFIQSREDKFLPLSSDEASQFKGIVEKLEKTVVEMRDKTYMLANPGLKQTDFMTKGKQELEVKVAKKKKETDDVDSDLLAPGYDSSFSETYSHLNIKLQALIREIQALKPYVESFTAAHDKAVGKTPESNSNNQLRFQ